MVRETGKVLHAALGYILSLPGSLTYLTNALLTNACAELDGLAQPLVCSSLKLEGQITRLPRELPGLV